MKTKEFVNKLETKGYKVLRLSQMDRGKLVLRNGESVAYIADEDFRVNIKVPIPQEDAELIICYAYKLLEERSENKYLVHLKGASSKDGFLGLDPDESEYFVHHTDGGRSDLIFEFTKPEINKLVEDPNLFLQKGSYTLELVDDDKENDNDED